MRSLNLEDEDFLKAKELDVDDIIEELEDAVRNGKFAQAIDILIYDELELNDSPKIKKFFKDNMSKLGKWIADEISKDIYAKDGELSDLNHFLTLLKNDLAEIGISIPNPTITKSLYQARAQIAANLAKGADRFPVAAILIVLILNEWGEVGITIDDIINVEGKKHDIIRSILGRIKVDYLRDLDLVISTLRKKGIDWPELDTIESSLKAIRDLKESEMQTSEYLKVSTEEEQLDAVKKDGTLLRYIKDPSDRVKIEAIRQNPWSYLFMEKADDAVLDDPEVKDAVMRAILKAIQNDETYSAEYAVKHLRKLGCRWTELSAIEKSMGAARKIEESFYSNNKIREQDDANTVDMRIKKGDISGALAFAHDSRSVYGITPNLDRVLYENKAQILSWLESRLEKSIKDAFEAYRAVKMIVSWPEIHTWWNDHKDQVLVILLKLMKHHYIDTVYNIVDQYLTNYLRLDWPELHTIMKSCKIDIYKRASLRESRLTDGEDPRWIFAADAIRRNPWLIAEIPDPSEELQLLAVRRFPNAVKHIENPTEKVQIAAVTSDDSKISRNHAIEFIKDPSEAVQLAAVRTNGLSLQHIKDPSPAVIRAAIEQDSNAICYVPDPSEELQVAAVTSNAWSLQCIEDPSPAAIKAAILSHGSAIQITKQPYPGMFDDPEIKTAIIRMMLIGLKNNQNYLIDDTLKALQKHGVDWKELDLIRRSYDAVRKEIEDGDNIEEAWSNKYKKRINCSNPKGFSQKAHCAARRKRANGGKTKSKPVRESFDPSRYAEKARNAIEIGWIDNVLERMVYGLSVGKIAPAGPITDLLEENKDKIIRHLLISIRRPEPQLDNISKIVDMLRKMGIKWTELSAIEKSLAVKLGENFADGKGPGRPGDSRRHGIPKNATLAQLDKIGKGSGRKAQLARWQANMRRGKSKVKETRQMSPDHWKRYAGLLQKKLGEKDLLDTSGDIVAAVRDYGLEATPEITKAIKKHKRNIIRWMLTQMAELPIESVDYILSPILDSFAKLGIDWPELIMIRKSIELDLKAKIDLRNLTETIAPHGDPHNELKMMQAGTKPAALVNPWEFDKLYRPIIDGMGWEMIEYEIEGFDGHRFYVVAQPGEKDRARRIVQLVQRANQVVNRGGQLGPDYHRELGFLLGYKKEDIDHFIRNMFGEKSVAEGDVIGSKFSTKQAQKNKTPYRFNQEIADRIPMYDPKGRFGTYHKSGDLRHGDEIPFDRFEVVEKSNKVASIIGVAPDGKKYVVSTSPPELAHVLADAYNRGGFTDRDLQPVNMRTDENQQSIGAALTVFDIDETLFHTAAKIMVVKDGEVVKELDNKEFNTYLLEPGESFDFSQFTDAQFFHDTSVPIETMWKRAKITLDGIGKRPGSRVIIVTARSDFDDKELFLNTFRKHGLDIDKIHVHRAGNLNLPSAAGKKKIIGQYLATGKFDMVRLFDDAESNLRSFLSLRDDYPKIKFKAYMVLDDGSIREYKD